MQRNYNEAAFSVHTEVIISMWLGSAPADLLPVTSAFPSDSWWVKWVLLLVSVPAWGQKLWGWGSKGCTGLHRPMVVLEVMHTQMVTVALPVGKPCTRQQYSDFGSLFVACLLAGIVFKQDIEMTFLVINLWLLWPVIYHKQFTAHVQCSATHMWHLLSLLGWVAHCTPDLTGTVNPGLWIIHCQDIWA